MFNTPMDAQIMPHTRMKCATQSMIVPPSRICLLKSDPLRNNDCKNMANIYR